MQPPIEVRRVAGDDPVARELVAAMEAWGAEALPASPGRVSPVTPGEMAPPHGIYVLVQEDGRPVAGGGVRRLDASTAEIKRMFVVPEARGRGHGRRLLEALEVAAAELGYRRVRLDTAAPLTTALALYRSAGYREIPPYNDNGHATFWGEKRLS